MQGLSMDIRAALRGLKKSPMLVIAILSIVALGVGASTAVFSVVESVVIKALPYPNSERLIWMTETGPPPDVDQNVIIPDYEDWLSQNHSFEDIGLVATHGFNLSIGDRADQVTGQMVTANLFPVLRVSPVIGRVFTEADDRLGATPVAILSYKVWQDRLGGDQSAIGKSVRIGGKDATIVGIMPSGFSVMGLADIWVPLRPSVNKMYLTSREFSELTYAIGRLRPGVSLTAARSEMEAIAAGIAAQYPAIKSGTGVMVNSLLEHQVKGVSKLLWILLGSVLLVLLIVCSNVASLLLVRATGRHREMAIRSALGAAARQLVRQMLVESCMLAVAGGAAGIVIALYAVHGISSILPRDFPRADSVNMDWKVLAFSVSITLLTGIVFGLLPARQAISTRINSFLSEGGSRSSGRTGRAQSVLVIAEVALAVLILSAGGLLMRSLGKLERVDPGFDANHLLSASVTFNPDSYPPARRLSFLREAQERLRNLPGVESTTSVFPLPFTPQIFSTYVAIEGWPRQSGVTNTAHVASIGPDYFSTMRIPLLKGRAIDNGDVPGKTPVAVVDQTLADHYWPNQDPVGRRLNLFAQDFNDKNGTVLTVAGVAGSVKAEALDAAPDEEIYVSWAQTGATRTDTFVVRSSRPASALIPEIREQVAAAGPDLPLFDVNPMPARIAESLSTRRLAARLLQGFAAIALLLGLIGLFGVMSYTVSQRTKEIGLRMSLGADPTRVRLMVIAGGMKLAGAGIVIGLVTGLFVMPLLSSQLFDAKAIDAPTIGGVTALAAVCCLLAAYLPARRASRVDPVVALRSE